MEAWNSKQAWPQNRHNKDKQTTATTIAKWLHIYTSYIYEVKIANIIYYCYYYLSYLIIMCVCMQTSRTIFIWILFYIFSVFSPNKMCEASKEKHAIYTQITAAWFSRSLPFDSSSLTTDYKYIYIYFSIFCLCFEHLWYLSFLLVCLSFFAHFRYHVNMECLYYTVYRKHTHTSFTFDMQQNIKWGRMFITFVFSSRSSVSYLQCVIIIIYCRYNWKFAWHMHTYICI